MSSEGNAYGEFRFKPGAEPLKLIEAKYKEKHGIDSYTKFRKHVNEALFVHDGRVYIDEDHIDINVDICDLYTFIDEFMGIFKDFIPIIESGEFEYTYFDENETGCILIKDGEFFDNNDVKVPSLELSSLRECGEVVDELLQNLDTLKNNYPALLKILSKHGKGPYAGMTDLEFFAAYKE